MHIINLAGLPSHTRLINGSILAGSFKNAFYYYDDWSSYEEQT